MPPIVLVYIFSMLLTTIGVFERNAQTSMVYELNMNYLLPSMLFLILLGVKISDFFFLGKKLILAYILALSSIVLGFVVVTLLFGFNKEIALAFGAISGSWMGGSANMVAVARALEISQTSFSYALIVDSVNYTFWIAFLLFLIPFADRFNNFSGSTQMASLLKKISKPDESGKTKYTFLLLLALSISLISNLVASNYALINYTTTSIIIATLFGIALSFSRLSHTKGSSELSSFMLYLLIALIGSRAVFEDFSGAVIYVLAGGCILIIHAIIMVVGAKIFKLDLFSISVASLANIGGVASASLLAATYNRALVGVGALMAIMGYILGTIGGLLVAKLLVFIATKQ